ncbi:hypothetical protein BC828DRAFT_376129 [Blastocladiella britannica]|nr:hypothetical protein BC828DRAFT_376129 [Blastocladiella britannica]
MDPILDAINSSDTSDAAITKLISATNALTTKHLIAAVQRDRDACLAAMLASPACPSLNGMVRGVGGIHQSVLDFALMRDNLAMARRLLADDRMSLVYDDDNTHAVGYLSHAWTTNRREIVDVIVASNKFPRESLQTAVVEAASAGAIEVYARLMYYAPLLNVVVSPYAPDCLAAEHAIVHQRPEMLAYIIQTDPHTTTETLNPLLERAVSNGSVAALRALLADPRCDPTANNHAALAAATHRIHPYEFLACLLADPRVDPSAQENEAFITALQTHDAAVVLLFLKHPRLDLRRGFSDFGTTVLAQHRPVIVSVVCAHPDADVSSVWAAAVQVWMATGRRQVVDAVTDGIASMLSSLNGALCDDEPTTHSFIPRGLVPVSWLANVPALALSLMANHLSPRTLSNLRQTCRALRAVGESDDRDQRELHARLFYRSDYDSARVRALLDVFGYGIWHYQGLVAAAGAGDLALVDWYLDESNPWRPLIADEYEQIKCVYNRALDAVVYCNGELSSSALVIARKLMIMQPECTWWLMGHVPALPAVLDDQHLLTQLPPVQALWAHVILGRVDAVLVSLATTTLQALALAPALYLALVYGHPTIADALLRDPRQSFSYGLWQTTQPDLPLTRLVLGRWFGLAVLPHLTDAQVCMNLGVFASSPVTAESTRMGRVIGLISQHHLDLAFALLEQRAHIPGLEWALEDSLTHDGAVGTSVLGCVKMWHSDPDLIARAAEGAIRFWDRVARSRGVAGQPNSAPFFGMGSPVPSFDQSLALFADFCMEQHALEAVQLIIDALGTAEVPPHSAAGIKHLRFAMLRSAAKRGHVKFVRTMVQQASDHGMEWETNWPLEMALVDAAMHGHADLVEWLVTEGGMDPTFMDGAAYEQAKQAGHDEVVRRLAMVPSFAQWLATKSQ